MTIATTTNRVDAPGNGSATSFSFAPVVIFAATDLQVTVRNSSGAETVLARGASSTNYSVSVASYPGTGAIVYPASGGTPLPAGSTIVIKRLVPILQSVSLSNQGAYFPKIQEGEFDYLTAIDQQQQEQLNRTLQLAPTDPAIPLTLPTSAARANNMLGFDSLGNPVAAQPASAIVSSVMASVVSAGSLQIAAAMLGSPGFFNVKNPIFAGGAKGDGVADDTAAIQAADNAARVGGGVVGFPPGTYNVNALFGTQTTVSLFGSRVSWSGAGWGATRLVFQGTSGATYTYTGNVTGSGIEGGFVISGIGFYGNNVAATTGLSVNKAAHIVLRDCLFLGFGNGATLVDVLSSKIEGCLFNFNNQGLSAQFGSFSDPNAISFYSCEIANNANCGVTLGNPSTVSFYGGAIEGNGVTGSAPSRYGVLINNAPSGASQGLVGASFHGVYFEANAGAADVWLLEGGTPGPSAATFVGCTFNRISGTAGQFVTNNIRLDLTGTNASQANMALVGNGFGGFNSYAPSGGTPYVIVNTGGATLFEVVDIGNIYNEAVETPAFANLKTLRTRGAPATPPAGQFYLYMDSADSKLKCKGPSGTVTILGVP